MRYLILAISMLLSAAIPAHAQIGVGFRSHDVSISFHVSAYPRLVAIPGYPVYYDPRANSNYFFYDGLYWVFEDDNWYSSAWYDGPWDLVDPEYVPLFVLRVPVRYYRHRPAYFSGWSLNFAPRWGEHWGHDWEQHRSGWDRWDRHSVPRAAPLPSYQARYSGSRYPRAPEQQYSIQSRSYRYQPREQITRQYFQQRAATTGAPAGTQQQVQTQQQTRVRDQTRAQQQSRAREQAQGQQRTRATQQQAQTEQRTRAREQAQAQQQTRATQQQTQQRTRAATQQAQTQQRTRAREQAQAQQQTRANQQAAQAQQRTRSNEQAQARQQARASQQAQAQQQTRAREQPQARQQQQQQQPSRERAQVQQRQQQAAARAKGPSNQQKQQQQKKEKEDKKDGGGQGGQ